MPVFTIKSKMVLLVLIVLIPLSILEVVRINNEYHENVSIELKASEDLANSMSSSFSKYIQELWVREAALGNLFVLNCTNADDIQNCLLKIKTEGDPLTELSWIGTDGTIIASQNSELIGSSVLESDYFKDISAGEDKVITDLCCLDTLSETFIMISRRIETEGMLQGVIAGRLDPYALLRSFEMSDHSFNRDFGFIDRKGNMLSFSGKKDNGTSASYIISLSDNGTLGDLSDIIIEDPVGLAGWKCFVSTNYDMVTKNHKYNLANNLTILALVLAISVLVALIIARRTLDPLVNIKETISAVKNGNYTVRSNIYGRDELAATAQEIDVMVDTILANDLIKSQAFTDLSHELKTPLNVIYASSQLIESTFPQSCPCDSHGKVLKYSKSIRHNCYKLIKIISNLLDVAKYENGHLNTRMGTHNIISIIEDSTMSVVTIAESIGINIIFDTDVEEKYTVCDQGMIERIMLNLLSNALKFTDSGGRISVSITSTVDRLIIRVEDTGIGIPPDRLKHIFDRFKQADPSLNRNHYGSGLGLTLVKSMVEVHKGTIYVTSDPGKGTSFIIHLPIIKPSETETPSENGTDTASDSTNLNIRVNIELSDINDISKR